MPEAAEEMSLKVLGSNISIGREIKLGKQSSRLISRLFSSKLPARFDLTAAKKYMAENWGLGPSRQSSVLLFAITSEPTARLASVETAKKYLDGLTTRYAQSCGLILRAQLPETAIISATQAVNPATVEEITKGQKRLAHQQMKLLADFLQVGTSQSIEGPQYEATVHDLQRQLATWNSEFSEGFALGIKARFDKKKIRQYNAEWNLVRQDVLRLWHNLQTGWTEPCKPAIKELEPRVVNRATLAVHTYLQSIVARCPDSQRSEETIILLEKLAATVFNNVHLPPKFRCIMKMTRPSTEVDESGSIKYREVPRNDLPSSRDYVSLLKTWTTPGLATTTCFNLKSRHAGEWQPHLVMTKRFLSSVSIALDDGLSFAGKVVLVTGAGPGSIGAECARALLKGGAQVILTTSRDPSESSSFYRGLYEDCGAKGSELIVLPLNQGSASDCEALVDHIYSDTGLARDLDAILPFAAISEGGFEIDALGGKSELAHRLMLVNVLRLLGSVITNKRKRHILCHPTQVLLPLSPNHGIMGGDGLYSESKLGLESLLQRVSSESWSDELTICGIIIGWTRGTGLMSSNDIIAEEIERHGVLTFSQQEMAFNITMLMANPVVNFCEDEPIIADFGGGLDRLEDCKSILSQARTKIDSAVNVAKAIEAENQRERSIHKKGSSSVSESAEVSRRMYRSSLQIGFPPLPDFEKEVQPLERLHDMVDHSSTVVVVGFSELGPWGSSRTRWEIESKGEISQEGFIELAWIMNLIKHFNGDTSTGHYVGWVDVKTNEQVHDSEVEAKYGRQILRHAGIRLIEPEAPGGYDPNKKEYLQEIAINEDLLEFHATPANAEALKLKHGEHIVVRKLNGSDDCAVQIKRGARIQIAKTNPFNRSMVAGQIPTGWNPASYGIQDEVINQVDPATLYTLCCVAEALYSAGITDSMEVFKYIHLSELGNLIGSSMGGPSKTREMYKDIYLDKDVQSDIIQETYLNTPAAWVNMLLLGSTGPIKTPVGACATGVESIDTGCDSILSGKTKMCIVGGVDDFQEEESFGFAKMQATVDTAEQLAQGRLPSEMSRPTSDTRAGFVESHGCGVQIICTASLALEMGLPIYGIIAGSTMAADKISRSVPAPGQGVLTFARETARAGDSPLLDLEYRREQMQLRMSSLGRSTPNTALKSDASSDSSEFVMLAAEQGHQLEGTMSGLQTVKRHWSTDLRSQDPNISPLRAALAVWDLTIDDIDMASLHATSTKANDKNEPDVIDKQMQHLGRTAGHPIPAICQKSVTGHPKAPAAAWMLNGCLQALSTGLIPGNRNADNVDSALRKFEHLVFPTSSIQTKEIKAFLLTSFGFGQKGGQIVGVAPKYLFATLSQDQYDDYARRCKERKQLASRAYVKSLTSNKIVRSHDQPLYEAKDESKIFLNPLSRVAENSERQLHFDPQKTEPNVDQTLTAHTPSAHTNLAYTTESDLTLAARISQTWIEEQSRQRRHEICSVGIDVVNLATFSADDNETFVARNYTHSESTYAKNSLDPHATYAGRWCAKEAVFKCLDGKSKGAGAAMGGIEILSEKGPPKVKVS